MIFLQYLLVFFEETFKSLIMNNVKTFFTSLVVVLMIGCSDDSNDDSPTVDQTVDFTVTVENIGTAKDYFSTGTIDGLTMPGGEVSFTFNAAVGHYLSFATMYVQTNDLFLGPSENGFALYDTDGNAIIGDITHMIDLWDAGTEVNEEPGVGPNQAPRQAGPDTGADENGVVKLIADVGDGYTYPMVSELAEVILGHDGGTEFTLTIRNISNNSAIPSPFAPGIWVVHSGSQTPLFVVGEAASSGLEDIAEDGDNTISNMELSEISGLNVPFSPGAFAVNEQVFVTGEAATMAFENVAEDGDPSGYANLFNTPDGSSAPAPIFFGESYSFSFSADPGDVLSWATMFIQSNDWVVGGNNIALFNNGSPITGDVTAAMAIYDAGTEVDEYPGAGPNQAPRQAGPNTGMDENGMVALETNLPANVPALEDIIRITITVN